MNNLETEYKAKVEAEVPDLWDRINASLDEEEKKDVKKKKNLVWVRFGEIAAVAACLIITVLVVKDRSVVKGRESADEAYEAAATEAAVCESAEESFEEPATRMDESVMYESAGIEKNAEAVYEEAPAATEVSSEETGEEYIENPDGTYSYMGYDYLYLLYVTGIVPDTETEITYTVLSNRDGVTFEEIFGACGVSSDSGGHFAPEDMIVVSFE